MLRKALSITAVALLAACDGENQGGTIGGTPVFPAELAGNLNAASYDAVADTLRLDMDLDGTAFVADYTRRPDLDVPGYEAYVARQSPDRSFLALFRENPRGTLVAGAVGDNAFAGDAFGGSTYVRIDTWSVPRAGTATYIGSYAGVFGTGATDPVRTQGTARLEARFAAMEVGGEIGNRAIVGGAALPAQTLATARIDANGEFLGATQFPDLTTSGTYGGIFGGVDATDVAGVMVFTPIQGSTVREFGSFNVARCGTAGADPACP
ncbi:hypothetical protein ACRDNQ_12595 [Palleronia sp. KMU-117]|uniref:hypothetical protein n=1 Tax=Palleronia sp. KMU-117 TaxID=3434108 RepID=UPI003D73D5A3